MIDFLKKILCKKFKSLGYICTDLSKYAYRFNKYDEDYKFTKVIDVMHKKSGQHIVQCYDNHTSKDDRGMYVNCVCGMTKKELKLSQKALIILILENKLLELITGSTEE